MPCSRTQHGLTKVGTKILKLGLTNSNHIVLATFGVRYDSRFALDV